ncbi:MAG TPA: hypothetical protein PK359_04910 [Burkholderiaceae bacterium]|nr:hypothetical protein [Burkholderiaceae bacterium]
MQDLLDNPAVQAGGGPLLVALIVALLLARTPAAWLAIAAGYATMLALSTGLSFSPLTASRKVALLVLLAPVAGLIIDRADPRATGRAIPVALGVAGGLAALWAMASVLSQRESAEAITRGALVFVSAAGIVALVARLRSDGVASAAAGLGLGLASGVAALLSASVGYFMSGVAVAAASGAMLLVQMVLGRSLPAGSAGSLTVGLAAALFASASLMLAQLPWYALPLMAVVPAVLLLVPRGRGPVWRQALTLGVAAVAAAAIPLLAAWAATLST